MRSRLGTHGGMGQVLLVSAVYALLTIVLTYPLALHLTTRIAGTNLDEGNFLWNTWWIKHALIDNPTNPLYSGVLFYPLGMSTALYTMAWLNGFLSLPITLLAGPILATNVATLLGFTLSALAMFLLVLDRLEQQRQRSRPTALAAFIAGLIFSFSSAHFLYAAMGHADYVSSQWLPFAALYVLRTLERPGRHAPVMAGLFAALAAYTELNYIVYLLVFVLTILVFAALRRSTIFSRALLGRLIVAAVVFAIAFAPLGIPVVRDTMTSGSSLVQGWGYADMLVTDLLGPLTPSVLHPILGALGQQMGALFTDRNLGFAGFSVLALALIGAIAGRRRPDPLRRRSSALDGSGVWVVVAVVFFVFSLGPMLHINGQSVFNLDGLKVSVPLPYIVIHYLPFLKASRVPARFGIIEFMALAMLSAFAVQAILGRLRSRGAQALAAAAIACLVLFENLSVPLPTNVAQPPQAYDIIAADPGEFTIIQVPLGWRDGWHLIGPEHTLLQAYQMVHGKNILAGNASRLPGQTFDYFTRAPILTSILNYEEGRTQDPAIDAGDRALAPSLLSFLNVRYFVVHGDYVNSTVDKYIQTVLPVDRVAEGPGQEQASSWIGGFMGKSVATGPSNAGWVLYKVRPAPGGPPTTIDLGTNSAHVHQTSGWSFDETVGDVTQSWVDGKQATVLLRLDQPVSSTLTVRASPFSYEGAPPQRLSVAVNGHALGEVAMQPGWAEYSFNVPTSALQPNMNEIKLTFANAASPSAVFGSSDRRNLSAAVDWMRMEAQP